MVFELTRSPTRVAAAVADAHRREWGFVLAATVRVTRDLDLAEECVQDAYARALTVWAEHGVPARPAAWLTTTARSRALDLLRRDALFRRAMPELVMDDEAPPRRADRRRHPGRPAAADLHVLPPGAGREAQVALTLRLLCGLSTAEVARAFLVSEPTMAARITRAKKKIAALASRTGCRRRPSCPPASPPSPRSSTCCSRPATPRRSARSWCAATSSSARSTWPGCCVRCCPASADVAGLLALLLLTDARRETRLDDRRPAGAARRPGPRAVGPRRRSPRASGWSARRCAPARRAGTRCRRRSRPSTPRRRAGSRPTGPRSSRCTACSAAIWPSPVVALNRAVAVGFARGPAAGLAALDALADEPQLAGYGYLAAARADFLRRLGRDDERASPTRKRCTSRPTRSSGSFLQRPAGRDRRTAEDHAWFSPDLAGKSSGV